MILTLQEIRRLLEGKNFQTKSISEIMEDVVIRCIDGRLGISYSKKSIAYSGGSTGLLMAWLSSLLTRFRGVNFTSEQMDDILDLFIQVSGVFYIHTDQHTLDNIKLSENELKNPSKDKQEELLKILSQLEGIGCGHIGCMYQNPAEYYIDNNTLKLALQAIYRRFWSPKHDDVVLEVLQGEHTEQAVLNIIVKDLTEGKTLFPMIPPTLSETSFFVNYPNVAHHILLSLADEFGEHYDLDRMELWNESTVKADHQTTATLRHLAKGLPVFNVIVDGCSGKILDIEE
jgi:hypothetical protein